MVKMDEEHNCESTLIDKWISFDSNSVALERWLNMFGEEDIQRSLMTKIDAN